MFINEERDQLESDVIEPSSEAQAPVESTPAAPVEAAPASPDPAPFHEHPRFKELVEQKNTYAQQTKALQDQIAQMQARMEQLSKPAQQPKPADELHQRLKGIDPVFGERFEQLEAARQQVEEMRAWKEEMERERTRTQAVQTVNSLHEQHKVAAEDRDLYQSLLELQIQKNPTARMEDLPALYKNVHEMVSKRYDALKRSERESYVKEKSVDSKVPSSQPKGKAVSHNRETDFSKMDPETARREAVSQIVKQMRAERDPT